MNFAWGKNHFRMVINTSGDIHPIVNRAVTVNVRAPRLRGLEANIIVIVFILEVVLTLRFNVISSGL